MNRLLTDLGQPYAGRPVVVLGGGPSLPSDLARIRSAAAWLSANEHGARLWPCNAIVCCDNLHQVTREPMEARLRPFGLPIISPQFWADVRIDGDRVRGNSGMWAIYAAWRLGAWPVITAGIDCYRDGTYWHDRQAESSGTEKAAEHWAERFGELIAMMPGAQVRAVSGPLLAWYPQYQPDEVLGEYTPPALHMAGPVETVRVRRNALFGRVRLRQGDDLKVTAAEAEYLVARGSVIRLEAAA